MCVWTKKSLFDKKSHSEVGNERDQSTWYPSRAKAHKARPRILLWIMISHLKAISILRPIEQSQSSLFSPCLLLWCLLLWCLLLRRSQGSSSSLNIFPVLLLVRDSHTLALSQNALHRNLLIASLRPILLKTQRLLRTHNLLWVLLKRRMVWWPFIDRWVGYSVSRTSSAWFYVRIIYIRCEPTQVASSLSMRWRRYGILYGTSIHDEPEDNGEQREARSYQVFWTSFKGGANNPRYLDKSLPSRRPFF